jgi:hypothetical protein
MRWIASASPAAGPIARPTGRAFGTAAGFFIDTIDSPFDVFTVFGHKFNPKKKHPTGA